MKLPGILVAPGWLRALLATRTAGELVLADVRWEPDGSARAAFEAGHLPGAVSIDVETDLARPAFDGPGRHPLPSPVAFARRMAAAGIGDGTAVVAYDDAGGSLAARLWWMLHVTGHDVALLDLPSLTAWADGGGLLETGPAPIDPARFTPRPWPDDRVVDAYEVRSALVQGSAVVVDARAGERYRGQTEPIDPVPGHIPGALNAEWSGNRDPATGAFLSPEALRSRYAALGIRRGDDAIAYCGSGVTAAMDVFAMELAGLRGSRLYEGSWSDWISDGSMPVAKGSEPGEMPGG